LAAETVVLSFGSPSLSITDAGPAASSNRFAGTLGAKSALAITRRLRWAGKTRCGTGDLGVASRQDPDAFGILTGDTRIASRQPISPHQFEAPAERAAIRRQAGFDR
jgi:hypothetical protein